MKKTRFYRICRGANRDDRIFRADDGYIYRVKAPSGGTIEFAIAKCAYNEWDITHTPSGLAATVCPFRTKKDAVQQLNDPDYIAAVDHIASGARAQECAQLLTVYKQAQ